MIIPILFCFSSCFVEGGDIGFSQQLMYVWAGPVFGNSSDIIAVFNFEEAHPNFLKLEATIPLTGSSSMGNEPHHAAFNLDKTTFATGGLLSILKGQDEVFFFDPKDPLAPIFKSSSNPPLSAVTDEFVPLKNGGFAVTMMGKNDAMCPGKVAVYDAKMNLEGEYPIKDPEENPECFCPHGIAVDEERGIALTGDFVVPGSLYFGEGVVICPYYRVWDWKTKTIVKTVSIAPSLGVMNVLFVPNSEKGYAYIFSQNPKTNQSEIYLWDPELNNHRIIFTLPDVMRMFSRFNQKGDLLFFGSNMEGEFLVIDTSNVEAPRLLQRISVPNSGLHFTRMDRWESYVVSSGYFLVGGRVHEDGDHKLHVFGKNGGTEYSLMHSISMIIDGIDYRPHGLDFWWKVNPSCGPRNGMKLKECNKLISKCTETMQPMKWTKGGCKLNDAGCQCASYCGFKCEKSCISNKPFCEWREGKCYQKDGPLGKGMPLC